jgi:hypothetical protein
MEIGLTAYDMSMSGIGLVYIMEFDGQLQEEALRQGLTE